MKFFSYFVFLLCSVQVISGFSIQQKQGNTISFSKEELLQKKGVTLNENWEFYWKEFINPDAFDDKKPLGVVQLTSWTNYLDKNNTNLPAFGYATYKINFSIPEDSKNLSLYIPRIIGSYKIWINGVFILETGKIGTSKETTLHRRFTKIIPLNFSETNFEVVLQVANFYNKKGGITTPILLGKTDNLFYKKSLQMMVDMVSIGSFAFIGILFLVFYLFFWSKDQTVLYFSVLCIALSYHTLNDRYAPLSKIFDNISWVFLTKTEYIASYIVGYAASLFFALILKKFVHKWYTKLVFYCTTFLIVAAILLPAPHFTELITIFFVFMLLNIFYIIFITIKAIIAKSRESKLLLWSIVFATVVFFGHILFFIYENEAALIYVKFGYILLFLFVSMLLLQRFSYSFQKLEFAKKIALQQKMEISTQSKALKEVNLKLKENLKLLESNNEELEDFNHIVSHDLKTPLISVYSLASFIEDDLKDKLDANTKNYLKMMKDVVSKMEASINGLLEYSKVAKGDKRKEWVSVYEILNNVIGLIDHQNKSTFNFPKKDLAIYTNKLELEHVFQNLFSNSIKYNDKEKTIITINAVKRKNECRFSVSDNGPGIERQYHDKIFKIFSQLETNAKDINSTGIGLAIVKKIISNNNGVLSVNSEKGKGLTINFTWQLDVETTKILKNKNL